MNEARVGPIPDPPRGSIVLQHSYQKVNEACVGLNGGFSNILIRGSFEVFENRIC